MCGRVVVWICVVRKEQAEASLELERNKVFAYMHVCAHVWACGCVGLYGLERAKRHIT
jgi:hypothetical protein